MSITKNMELTENWEHVHDLIIKTSEVIYNKRPTCTELLVDWENWSVKEEQLKSSLSYREIVNLMKKYKNKFFFKYLVEKLIF